MRYPRRLASRLSVSFVLLFLVTFTVVAALTLYYADRVFQRSLDDTLHGIAETVDQRLKVGDTPPDRVVEDVSSAAQFVELTTGAGIITARSSILGQRPLPVSLRSLRPTEEHYRTAKFFNTDLRILTSPIDNDGAHNGYIIAASPIPEVNDAFGSLTVVMAVAGSVGLVIAGTGTVWLSRRESRPLQDLADEVQVTAASGFQKGIPPEGDGSLEARELREAVSTLVDRQREVIGRERAFFADSSHVLRTPLAVLQGDIELLEQGVYGKERQEVVAQARAAIGTMSRAVNGLLLLSREHEAAASAWEAIDLSKLLEGLVAEARVASPALQFSAEIAPGLELAGDPHQLKDLFVSLLENASHYTPDGGNVYVGARLSEEGTALVEIRDNGIGLSETEAEHALERFYRGPRARRMFPAGSGLGLAIADQISRIHGGELSLRPNDDRGATATVRLPLLT